MADTLSRVMVQVYSKLAATFNASNTVSQPSDAIMSFMIPGLLIDTKLNPDDPQTQYYVANALDPTLACSWTVSPQGATVSQIYRAILDGKETPLVELPPQQRERVDAALTLLFVDGSQPTELYRTYLEWQSNYFNALDAYEQARATADNGGASVPPAVREALVTAEREWDEHGHRAQVDNALETLRLFESYEPSVYWARLARQFAQWTRSYGYESFYQHITSIPPFHRWFTQEGWSTFRFDRQDAACQQRSGAAGMGAAPAAGAMNLRIDDRPLEGGDDPVVEDVQMFCRLRRVEIVRPWMDINVFRGRTWRWSPGSVAYGTVIATGGDLAGGVVPGGTMPVLPVSAVLSRDLLITWKDTGTQTLSQRLRRAQDAGQRISLGPFDLSGARGIESGRIDMPDPQLIGFRSLVLPKCPDPDPDLPWPTTAPSPMARLARARVP